MSSRHDVQQPSTGEKCWELVSELTLIPVTLKKLKLVTPFGGHGLTGEMMAEPIAQSLAETMGLSLSVDFEHHFALESADGEQVSYYRYEPPRLDLFEVLAFDQCTPTLSDPRQLPLCQRGVRHLVVANC